MAKQRFSIHEEERPQKILKQKSRYNGICVDWKALKPGTQPKASGRGETTPAEKIMFEFDEEKFKNYLKGKNWKDDNVKLAVGKVHTLQRVWGVTAPTQDETIALKGKMLAAGKQPATINSNMFAIKWWAQSIGGTIDLSDNGSCPMVPVVLKRVKLPSITGIKQMLADEKFKSAIRDYTIVCVLLDTGMRESELAAAKMSDFITDPITGRPTNKLFIGDNERDSQLKGTKESKTRIAPLRKPAMQVLNRWLTDSNGRAYFANEKSGDYLFIGRTGEPLEPQSIKQMMYRWHQYFVDCKYFDEDAKWSPHVLRKLWCRQQYLEEKTPKKMIKQAGGWGSDFMVDLYLGDMSEDYEAAMASAKGW